MIANLFKLLRLVGEASLFQRVRVSVDRNSECSTDILSTERHQDEGSFASPGKLFLCVGSPGRISIVRPGRPARHLLAQS